MADTSKLLEALSSYTGDQTTLEAFTLVAKQELGEDWAGQIYDTLPNLPAHLKEKLDHAYNYYGASLSWTEIQSYLQSQEPLNISEVSQRVETLSYWLNFFGEAGTNAVNQLKEKLEAEQQTQSSMEAQPSLEEAPLSETEAPVYEEAYQETPYEEPAQEAPYDEVEPSYDENQQNFDVQNEQAVYEEPSQEEIENAIYEQTDPVYEEPYQEAPYEEAYQEAPYEEPYQEEYNPSYEEPPYQEETYQNDTQDLYGTYDTYENTGYQDGYDNGNAYENTGYQDSYDVNGVHEGDGREGSYDNQEYVAGDGFEDSYDNQEYLDEDGSFWQEPVYKQQENETIEEFMAKKAFHQVDFLNAVQCWVNARCIALGNKEIYTYRHYGFLIDLMEETKKDVQEVLSAPKYYPAIESVRQEGLKKLQRFITSLENDLKTAYDNLPSELTDLISDQTSANDLRKMLGGLDTSNKPELLGEAPDGFEMLEDPFEGTSIAKEMKKKTTPQTPAGITSAPTQPVKKTGLSFNKKTAL